jgi:hypothetical protein
MEGDEAYMGCCFFLEINLSKNDMLFFFYLSSMKGGVVLVLSGWGGVMVVVGWMMCDENFK